MDLDGDGFLSMYELEYFYEEQLQRMEQLGIETLPFEDCLCQVGLKFILTFFSWSSLFNFKDLLSTFQSSYWNQNLLANINSTIWSYICRCWTWLCRETAPRSPFMTSRAVGWPRYSLTPFSTWRSIWTMSRGTHLQARGKWMKMEMR